MLHIGPYTLASQVLLAPMAGVSDLPFRQLCRGFGAALVTSEMITSDTSLWHSRKSRQRLPHADDPKPRSVQIAGAEPAMMAEAARRNVELGAEIIDINMGCPAKKVCKKAAGSALLQHPDLVKAILQAVTDAVAVPVTLKIRTGWSPEHRNAVEIARIAEDAGIQALAIHGRTRACRFKGEAEYDTIAAVKQAIAIPVIANGDIRSPQQAKQVLQHTGADAIMIGRAAQGQPWIFQQINHYLQSGELLPAPPAAEIGALVEQHLQALEDFYGEHLGPRIARKHLGWYLSAAVATDSWLPAAEAESFRKVFNGLPSTAEQLQACRRFFARYAQAESAPFSNPTFFQNPATPQAIFNHEVHAA